MSSLLRDEIRKARKPYHCGAYHWINQSCFGEKDFEPEDWKKICDFLDGGGKIATGEDHIYQVGIQDGDFSVFRANKVMHQICHDYDLYPED